MIALHFLGAQPVAEARRLNPNCAPLYIVSAASAPRQLVRENLHIVLAMSPIGAAFRNRCRMFPSLINYCTIDWFNAWPEEALYSVAQRFLADKAADLGFAEHVNACCEMAMLLHSNVEKEGLRYARECGRKTYTTPTSYLELIKLYLDMLGRQRETVSGNEQRYRGGLQKLAETEDMVAELQETLTKMGPDLKKAAKETEELLVKVDKDQKAADKQQAIVEKDVEEANKVAKSVGIMAEDCQRDLDAALPAYYEAIKALDALDKKSIQELKSFPKPPPMVAYTLEAICILFGVKPNWDESKKLMGDSMFMKNLETYDKDNISPKVIKQLKKFVDNPDFMPAEVKKVSSAAMCLCMWARAMYMYDTVAKTIAPKKAALATAQGELKEVQDKLAVKQEQLRAVLAKVVLTLHTSAPWSACQRRQTACRRATDRLAPRPVHGETRRVVAHTGRVLSAARAVCGASAAALSPRLASPRPPRRQVAELKATLAAAVARKEELSAQEERCKVQLVRADQLLGGLGGEKVRWAASAEQLGKDMINLVGNMLLASGFIAYLGPFISEVRSC